MNIRREVEADYQEIYNLVKVAFQTAEVTSGHEQDFVNELRQGCGYIPELALVAEEAGALIGHIMLTRTTVVDGDRKADTLFLGPVSVVLEQRKRGVGSALIREAMRLAREMGYTSVVLVGNPAYYHRFGYRSSADFGIRHALDIPEENVMACELTPNALQGIRGVFDC